MILGSLILKKEARFCCCCVGFVRLHVLAHKCMRVKDWFWTLSHWATPHFSLGNTTAPVILVIYVTILSLTHILQRLTKDMILKCQCVYWLTQNYLIRFRGLWLKWHENFQTKMGRKCFISLRAAGEFPSSQVSKKQRKRHSLIT